MTSVSLKRPDNAFLKYIVILLLLIAASRIIRLSTLEMDVDESWSVWQIMGSPAQILAWTPYDWPPLSYLIMGAWRSLTGLNPITLRMLPLFVFLLGMACLYRVARRLFSPAAALLSVTACAALAMSIHLSTLLRGYVFVMALTPLALWCALRYFDHPSLRRAVPLGVPLAVMFYIHISAVFAIATIGLYTLIVYGRRVWHWWLPGIIAAVIVTPEFLSKAALAGGRAGSLIAALLATPFSKLSKSYLDFTGNFTALWAAIFVIAAVLLITRRGISRLTLALFVWILMPLALFFTAILGSNDSRQEGWVMIGIALWIGWGLSRLPRPVLGPVTLSSLALFSVLMFQSIPLNRYVLPTPLLAQDFMALTKAVQWGDVLLIDPNVTAAAPEQWYYYIHTYFPNGLQVVTSPDGYRRVWYVTKEGSRDPKTEQAVLHNRVPGTFFGPWDFLFRLYEAPPDLTGVPFENGLRFHGADLLEPDDNSFLTEPLVRHEGESFHVRLWWSVEHAIDRDYSITVQVIKDKDGSLVIQQDGPPTPADAPAQTSQWQPGRYYIQDITLTFPNPSESTRYTLALAVYQWWDNKRVVAPGLDANMLLRLRTITVTSW